MWIGIFYTAIPVGTAIGYTFSGLIASQLSWQYSFFIIAGIIFPHIALFFYVNKEYPIPETETFDNVPALDNVSVNEAGTKKSTKEGRDIPSLKTEVYAILSNWIWDLITFGSAAQCGTLIGLGTFGSSFGIALNYFDDEATSSTVFGIVLSLSGLIGSYAGGVLADQITIIELNRYKICSEDDDNNEFFNKKILIGPRKLTVKEAIAVSYTHLTLPTIYSV